MSYEEEACTTERVIRMSNKTLNPKPYTLDPRP
jgi:hypothetical protein